MKVMIAGGNGQLGWELQRTAPQAYHVIPLSHQDLDITDMDAVMSVVEDARPEVFINAAAYTAVDRAERERELAYAVNANGAANIAKATASLGAKLIHISTDFVFDGKKSSPYLPEDTPNPLSVYGASKLEGERRISELGKDQALIIRAAWVYSSHGSNFVKTILRLLKERDKLSVVSDQVGTPTWAKGLAQAIWRSIERGLSGIYHWTDAGVASWYDFAIAIQEEALAVGFLDKAIPVSPIRTEDYPTTAKRPAYSVLEKTRTWSALEQTALHWRGALRSMLQE